MEQEMNGMNGLQEKKYGFTGEIKTIQDELENQNHVLHRIIALKDFTLNDGTKVSKGELGGFIESEQNLSQNGNCWIEQERKSDYFPLEAAIVYGNAKVYDNATICSATKVFGNAKVYGNVEKLLYQPQSQSKAKKKNMNVEKTPKKKHSRKAKSR